MSSFNYVPRNEAQVEKRSNQSASKFAGVIKDDFNTFSARKDDNAIRILPPTWENPDHYGYDIWVHFSVGPDNGTVLCLSKMRRQACPICEFQAKAEAAGREDAGDYKPKRRVLVWIVERKTEAEKKTTEENPQIWTMPWTVDRDISKICKDREDGHLYQIDHPEVGYDVFFDKSGERELTKYTGFALSRRESSVNQAYITFIVQNPAPSVLLWRDYNEVKFLFEGEAVDVKQAAEVVPVTNSAPPVQSATPIAQPITMPTNGAATNHPPLAPPPPAAVAAPPPPPPPVQPFVSEWVTGQTCAVCNAAVYTIPEGITCQSGHVQKTIQFPTALAPAPPPAKTSAADRGASAANALQARFNTGPK